VCRMEDILDKYDEPYDEKRPLVCLDERPYQLISETRVKIPMKPGQVERYDYEYKREGTCNMFAIFQPDTGYRHIEVTEHRTKVDFAIFIKKVIDEIFPKVDTVQLVVDNLNIHTPSCFYEVFPPEEARRIVKKLEFHYTPKHGSWLNQVEIEFAVLAQQCLNRRLPDMDIVKREVAFWEKDRNDRKVKINWRFKTTDARIKLKRLYPF